MSILIRGVKMPTSCESCPCKTADAFGGLGCQATGYIPLRKVNQNRPDWCPLVPIAEPHGRLIDASEKIQVQMYDDMTEDYFSAEMTIDDLISHKDWVEADVPTIVPAEPEEEETK